MHSNVLSIMYVLKQASICTFFRGHESDSNGSTHSMQVPNDDGPSLDGNIDNHVYDDASDDSAGIAHGEHDDGYEVQGHYDEALLVKQVRERFWRVVNQGNKGQGFSRRDIRALIQLLTNEDEPIQLLGFKSMNDYLRFDEEMVKDRREHFWVSKEVGHELKLGWQHREGLEGVKTLLSDMANAPEFAFAPTPLWTDADPRKRIFSTIPSGEWWESVQVSPPF